MKRWMLPCFFVFCACTSFAQNNMLGAGGSTQKNYLVQLRYETIREKIIVQVVMGGRKRKFLLDTGAPTIISRSLYEELHPQVLNRQQVHDANGNESSMILVSLRHVVIDTIVFRDIPALVTNDPSFNSCFRIDGIIGSNLLRNCVVRFNSREKIITVTDDPALLLLDAATATRMLLDKQYNPYVTVRFAEGATENALFDTGSETLYDMGAVTFFKYRKKGVFSVTAKGFGAPASGPAGIDPNAPLYRLTVPRMEINGWQLEGQSCKTTSQRDSRIGAKLLQYGAVTIDYARGIFYFQPFAAATSGHAKQWEVTPVVMNGRLVAGAVWGEGIQQKVHPGDQILAINEKDYSYADECMMLQSPPLGDGSKAILKIKDSKGTVRVLEIKAL